MTEVKTLLDNVNFAEYDLNLFLVDDPDIHEEHDFYTIQPSAYVRSEEHTSELQSH